VLSAGQEKTLNHGLLMNIPAAIAGMARVLDRCGKRKTKFAATANLPAERVCTTLCAGLAPDRD